MRLLSRRGFAVLGGVFPFLAVEAQAQPTGTNSPSGRNPAPNTQALAAYTVSPIDQSIINNYSTAVATLTMPSATANVGRWLYLKSLQAQTTASAATNIALVGSSTATTVILTAAAGKWAELQSDGSNWIVMASN